MEKRQLGNTGLAISAVGLGTWAMGGAGWHFTWGPQDDADSIAAIRHAIDLGVNWIDTAAGYGEGHSEEIVARALSGVPASARPAVFTKCSLIWDKRHTITHSLAPASLRKELEDSLRRLRVEAIDLYQIHWPSWGVASARSEVEGAWRTLAEMQRQGKVRFLGVSNFSVEEMEWIRPIAPIGSLQPRYSMLSRQIEADILPYCARHNIGVIVYSPLQSGLLGGAMTRERIAALAHDDWRRSASEFQEPALSRHLELVERLRAIGGRHGRSVAEVALAWILRQPAITGAIVGARRPAQVDGFVGGGSFRLGAEEIAEIESVLKTLGLGFAQYTFK